MSPSPRDRPRERRGRAAPTPAPVAPSVYFPARTTSLEGAAVPDSSGRPGADDAGRPWSRGFWADEPPAAPPASSTLPPSSRSRPNSIRPRLVSSSCAARRCSPGCASRPVALVLVAAPPGAGKTTLLSQWMRRRRTPRGVAAARCVRRRPGRPAHLPRLRPEPRRARRPAAVRPPSPAAAAGRGAHPADARAGRVRGSAVRPRPRRRAPPRQRALLARDRRRHRPPPAGSAARSGHQGRSAAPPGEDAGRRVAARDPHAGPRLRPA